MRNPFLPLDLYPEEPKATVVRSGPVPQSEVIIRNSRGYFTFAPNRFYLAHILISPTAEEVLPEIPDLKIVEGTGWAFVNRQYNNRYCFLVPEDEDHLLREVLAYYDFFYAP